MDFVRVSKVERFLDVGQKNQRNSGKINEPLMTDLGGRCLLDKIPGGHAGVFFKGSVKYRFRIEAGSIHNLQNGLFFPGRFGEQAHTFFDPVIVDKVIKILLKPGIDDLRNVVGRYSQFSRQLGEVQKGVKVWFSRFHETE